MVFKFVLLLSRLLAIAALMKSMLQIEVFYVTTRPKNNEVVMYRRNIHRNICATSSQSYYHPNFFFSLFFFKEWEPITDCLLLLEPNRILML